MFTDMFIDICMDMSINMCIGMSIDMCIDMCMASSAVFVSSMCSGYTGRLTTRTHTGRLTTRTHTSHQKPDTPPDTTTPTQIDGKC